MVNEMTTLFSRAAEAIQSAKHIYITAGAGMESTQIARLSWR